MNEFAEFLDGGDHPGDHGKGEEEGQDQENSNPSDPTAKLFLEVNGRLPEDLRKVWGDSPHAREFIKAWGLEEFGGSKLNQLAVLENDRQARLTPLRKGFAKKGKK